MQTSGPAYDKPNLVERVKPRIRYDNQASTESVKEEDADQGDAIEMHPAIIPLPHCDPDNCLDCRIRTLLDRFSHAVVLHVSLCHSHGGIYNI